MAELFNNMKKLHNLYFSLNEPIQFIVHMRYTICLYLQRLCYCHTLNTHTGLSFRLVLLPVLSPVVALGCNCALLSSSCVKY